MMTTVLGAAAGVLVLIALGLVTWNHASETRPMRSIITLPPELTLMTTSENLGLAVSPDGTQTVFSAAGLDGHPQLWLRRLDLLAPESIPGTDAAPSPFESPNGLELGFFTTSELRRVNREVGRRQNTSARA